MALYTFYPRRTDDVSLAFEAYEEADDTDAMLRALHVLRDHDSARFVVVWCGDRKVAIRYRVPRDPELLLRRPAQRGAEA